MSPQVPLDIKPDWFNLIRRLQSAVSDNHGCAVIKVAVVVDETGKPMFWTEPTCTKIEPKRSRALLDLLSD